MKLQVDRIMYNENAEEIAEKNSRMHSNQRAIYKCDDRKKGDHYL